jgi:hypothetical protein
MVLFNRFGNVNNWVYEGQLVPLWKSAASLSFAPGSGLTAAADATISNTLLAKSGGYSGTGANWCALYTTQFTAAAKAGATEWTSGSDGSYARQAMGASGAGWTVNAYVSATGCVFWNNTTFNFPAVTSNAQTLFSVAFCDALTSGNIQIFSDLAASDAVAIGIQVQFNTTGSQTSDIAFTVY